MYAEFSSDLLPPQWNSTKPASCEWAKEDSAKNKTIIKGIKAGYIVLCDRSTRASFEEQAKQADRAGAAGLIIVNTEDNLLEMKSSRASVRAAISAAGASRAANTSLGGRKSQIPVVMIKSSDGKRLSELGSGTFSIEDKGHPEAKNEKPADEKDAVLAFVGPQEDEDEGKYEKRRDITMFAYNVLVKEFQIESLDISKEQWSRLRDTDSGLVEFCKNIEKIADGKAFEDVIREEALFGEIEEARITEILNQKPEKAPWKPDAARCTLCRHDFNVVRRRHHCRACGSVVCDGCSKNSAPAKGWEVEGDQRTCDRCCVPFAAVADRVGGEHQNQEPWVNGSKWANFFLRRLEVQIKSDRGEEAADKKKEAVSEAEAVRNKVRDVSDLGIFLKHVLEDAVGNFEPERLCAELQTHGIDSAQRLIQCFDPNQEVGIASSPNYPIFFSNN